MVLLGLLAHAWLAMMFGSAIAAPVVVLRKLRRFVFMTMSNGNGETLTEPHLSVNPTLRPIICLCNRGGYRTEGRGNC